MPKTYTVKQVADALGFSTNTVYKYLDEGKIRATRLGKEGRFRIPEEEVIRLLGLKGERPQIASQIQSPVILGSDATPESDSGQRAQLSQARMTTSHDEQAQEDGYEDKLSLLTKVSTPDLFDWFMSLTAIFLGVAYFLFPLNHQYIAFEPYRLWLLGFKVLLIGLGITLMAVDVFIPVKKFHHHLFIRLPLAMVFFGLSAIFFLAGENWSASYLISLAIFSLLPIFWEKGVVLKFILFMYFLTVLSGWAWAQNPQRFVFVDIRDFIFAHPGLFEVFLISAASIIGAIMTFGYYRSQPILLLFSWLVSGLFFLAAISFINDQSWNKAVVALMVGAFGIIFPFHKDFDTLARFTRKEVLVAFSWIVLVVLIGVSMIFYVQSTFKRLILAESQKRVKTAVVLVENFMEESIKYTNAVAQNPALVELISGSKTDKQGLIFSQGSKIKEDLEAFIKAEYQGATTLRRVVIVDKKGDVLALYPLGNDGSAVVNIADLEHFRESTGQKRTVISKLIKSRVARGTYIIVVASPVIDAKGNVLGMVGGGIDTAQLEDKLSTIEFGQTVSLTLADNQKTIFIHEDKNLIGQKAALNRSLIKAVEGGSGMIEGYSEKGNLSFQVYAHLPTTAWGIVAQQPVSEALRSSSLVSFSIFLVTILSGVGALLATVYLKKRRL